MLLWPTLTQRSIITHSKPPLKIALPTFYLSSSLFIIIVIIIIHLRSLNKTSFSLHAKKLLTQTHSKKIIRNYTLSVSHALLTKMISSSEKDIVILLFSFYFLAFFQHHHKKKREEIIFLSSYYIDHQFPAFWPCFYFLVLSFYIRLLTGLKGDIYVLSSFLFSIRRTL